MSGDIKMLYLTATTSKPNSIIPVIQYKYIFIFSASLDNDFSHTSQKWILLQYHPFSIQRPKDRYGPDISYYEYETMYPLIIENLFP